MLAQNFPVGGVIGVFKQHHRVPHVAAGQRGNLPQGRIGGGFVLPGLVVEVFQRPAQDRHGGGGLHGPELEH